MKIIRQVHFLALASLQENPNDTGMFWVSLNMEQKDFVGCSDSLKLSTSNL